MSDYLKKTITIKEYKESQDGSKILIKDQDGKSFSIFKQWEGQDTDAYIQFKVGNHNGPFTIGSHAQISYKEKPGEIQGKPVTYRNIVSMYATSAPAVSQSQTEFAGRTEANRGQYGASSGPKDDGFWEKQAYEKCCSLWAAARMQAGESGAKILSDIQGGEFHTIFEAIKGDGNKRFSPLRQAVQKHAPKVVLPEEELPVIQVEDDSGTVDVDGPF